MIFTIITVVFAAILILLAVASIEQKNIVRSLIFLMSFLFVLSADFIYLGATLIGAIELLVYVGAISALLLFTMMITGGREFE